LHPGRDWGSEDSGYNLANPNERPNVTNGFSTKFYELKLMDLSERMYISRMASIFIVV